MVHFTGDSSEDKEEDQGEMFEERVSFQDMLEQARAQSDIYSAKEDSEDKDFEPYTFQYKYEAISPTSVATAATEAIPDAEVCAFATDDCSTRQESSVSPCGDTKVGLHQLQAVETDFLQKRS